MSIAGGVAHGLSQIRARNRRMPGATQYIAVAATGHDHSQPAIHAWKKPGPAPIARAVAIAATMNDEKPVVSIANKTGCAPAGSLVITFPLARRGLPPGQIPLR